MNVWLQTLANATEFKKIWTSSSFNPARDVCQYVMMLFFPFQCVDANTCQVNSKVEINATVEYFNLSGHSYQYVMVRPLCINVCLRIPVNEIQRIKSMTSSALNPSIDVFEYVVLIFFLLQSVDAPVSHVT